MLDASAITTSGLVYTLFYWAESSRTEAKAEHACRYLN